MVDRQFISADYSRTAYELMDSRGIFTELERLPKYHNQVEELKQIRNETLLQFFVKRTTYWSLECDSHAHSSKETFHHLLETIGFTEQNRYGEILSHDERKFWIYCFLSQLVYLTIMALFLICGCSFQDTE